MSEPVSTPPALAGSAFARLVRAALEQLRGAAVSQHLFRNRARVIPKDMPTAVVVRLQSADADMAAGSGALSLWDVVLVVECYARTALGCEMEDALDELTLQVTSALLQDRTLGGVVADLALARLQWDFDADGERTGCAIATFVVRQAVPPAGINPL